MQANKVDRQHQPPQHQIPIEQIPPRTQPACGVRNVCVCVCLPCRLGFERKCGDELLYTECKQEDKYSGDESISRRGWLVMLHSQEML